MKKVISLVMALVMMMAVMVPAFAEELNANVQSGTATVQTDTSAITGDGTYTVTYPATMNIVWSTATTNFEYVVNSNLRTGKAVQVVVADTGDGLNMVNATNATLAYTLGGTTTGKTTGPVVTDATFNYSINVETTAWNAAAIDTYSDTLTFTSTVVDA
ncbi:MAG: hypothetical protein IIV47_01085 [Clostridia bacterium]|nr:hypothetical protein [Clostridia bacterium]